MWWEIAICGLLLGRHSKPCGRQHSRPAVIAKTKYLNLPPSLPSSLSPPPLPDLASSLPIRPQAKALYAALAQWNTLEVSVRVDRTIVTRLLSRSGRILAGISSNMGITLLVEREKGVLRGRARTEDDAKEANRVLKLKVNDDDNENMVLMIRHVLFGRFE